jgi:DNA mismatch repair protein MutS2
MLKSEPLFSPRLDLRGMRYDEAESALQRFLDRALLAGLNQIEIIHGKGTGALQKMTHEVLRATPGVRSYHFEDFDSGGTGATIVEL